MPYPSNDSLPASVKSKYSTRCQTVWRRVWTDVMRREQNEAIARRDAYTAANNCSRTT